MANWFECKVRYDKLQENGTSVKKVTETFLVDALSFTEAEQRIIEERQPYISGDFSVSAVKRTKIQEIFYDDTGDKWYLVKWLITTIDEKPAAVGKPPVEKKVAVLTLVQASDFQGALDEFMECMKNTMADFDIAQINETQILDVYPVKNASQKEAANQ
ncbi:MAG: DUF4494 domain-containing protein [Bacteroidales bacterium]|nr:DUF4494 domain-containing protein [Bacteroidales bacterium]MCD8387721.1 DUF4494 domain-containing protein [Bacteroidales bacterium]